MLGAAAEKREHRPRLVARLLLHDGVVDRAAVEARRRAGLQARDPKRQLAQAFGKRDRRRITNPATRRLRIADQNAPAQERANRQHDTAAMDHFASTCHDAGDRLAVDNEILDRLLGNRQVRL